MMNKIIFVSGWGTNETVWQNIITLLDIRFECIHIPWWKCLGKENLFSDTLDRIRDTVGVVGWSLGGIITLAGAIENPDKIGRMILISSTAKMTTAEDYPATDPQIIKAMLLKLKKNRDEVLLDFAKACFIQKTDQKYIKSLSEKMQNINSDLLSYGLKYLLKTDLRDKISQLKMPILVIHGKDDQIIPYFCGQYLTSFIPNSHLVPIKKAGHGLLISHPKDISNSIKNFLYE
jgi:pimeloyl-[acyl-carrier protein] methyl ester esterase